MQRGESCFSVNYLLAVNENPLFEIWSQIMGQKYQKNDARSDFKIRL